MTSGSAVKLRLANNPSIPIYEQVYDELKNRISSGHYEMRPFPSLQQASAEFEVSLIAVKRAFRRLHQEALISMSRGRNTYVRNIDQSKKLNSNFDALLSDINLSQSSTSVTIIEHNLCAASDDVCGALGCQAGTHVEQTQRLRKLDGDPFSLVTIAMLPEIAGVFSTTSFDQPVSADLFRSYGFRITDVHERISACIADRQIQRHLRVPDGAPVLKIVRTFRDEQAKPILCTVGYYRSDKYEYGGRRTLPASWQGV